MECKIQRATSAVCVLNSSVYMFSLCSLILGPQLPFPYPKTPLVCGPGGAGTCCPEDRGSAGSQKHLSMSLPLYCNPPGTALSSSVCKCVGKRKEAWMSDYTGVCVQRVCMSVFQPAPKHTILSVTHDQRGGCTTALSVLPTFQPPHMKTLTWLKASSSHPWFSSKLFQVDASGTLCLCSLLPFSCMLPFRVRGF